MSGIRPDPAHAPLACAEVRDAAPGFALDSLPPAAMEAIRAHLATCSDPHEELYELASGLPALWDEIDPVEPPAALRDRLLAAAASERPEGRAAVPSLTGLPGAAAAPGASSATPDGPGAVPARILPLAGRERRPVVGRPARRADWAWRLGAVAAAIVLVVLGGINLSLQRDLQAGRDREATVAAVLAAASVPGARVATLAPVAPGGPSGIAAITPDGRLHLAMAGLPPVDSGVWTAWVIAAGAAPANAGSFSASGSGIASLEAPAVASGDVVVAITREPRAGAGAPSGTPVAAGTAVLGS